MKLKAVKFTDESNIQYSFQLETSEPNQFWHTLIVKFSGTYGYGSGGRGDASFMLGTTETAVSVWSPAALILDLSALDYRWGDEMEWLLPPSMYVSTAVVVGRECAPAIATLLFGLDSERPATDAEFVFGSVEEAWNYVRTKPPDGYAIREKRRPPSVKTIGQIQEEASHALRFLSGHTIDTFRADAMTIDAVLWTVEMVGLASIRLSRDVKRRAPEIEWDELIRLRHHLLEYYYSIDHAHVFSVVNGTFPTLIAAVDRIKFELLAEEPPPPAESADA